MVLSQTICSESCGNQHALQGRSERPRLRGCGEMSVGRVAEVLQEGAADGVENLFGYVRWDGPFEGSLPESFVGPTNEICVH